MPDCPPNNSDCHATYEYGDVNRNTLTPQQLNNYNLNNQRLNNWKKTPTGIEYINTLSTLEHRYFNCIGVKFQSDIDSTQDWFLTPKLREEVNGEQTMVDELMINPMIEAIKRCPTAPPKKNALAKAFGLKTEEEAIGVIVGIVVGIIILICLLYVAMRPTRKPKAKQGPVKKTTSRK